MTTNTSSMQSVLFQLLTRVVFVKMIPGHGSLLVLKPSVTPRVLKGSPNCFLHLFSLVLIFISPQHFITQICWKLSSQGTQAGQASPDWSSEHKQSSMLISDLRGFPCRLPHFLSLHTSFPSFGVMGKTTQ